MDFRHNYLRQKRLHFKNSFRDFPGGPVVENPSYNAGDMDSIPRWGTRILHTVKQRNPRAATRESKCTTMNTQHSQKN